MKRLQSSLIIILLILSFGSSYAATKKDIDETKVANLTFEVSENLEISIEGKSVELEVEAWDRNVVDVTATIVFKGKENDRIREFLDNWESIVDQNIRQSSLSLTIDMNPNEPNKVQVGKNFMQVGYGKDELRIKYEIKVPAGNELSLKDSYEDVSITGAFTNKVEIQHYAGNLSGESFQDLELNLKYGKAKIGSLVNGIMQLYEQELEVKTQQSSEINAKYCKLDFEDSESLDFEAYESKIILGKSSRLVTGDFKYGRLTIDDDFKNIDIETYELEMELSDGESLRLSNSKYSEIEAGSIGKVQFVSSYEDDMTMESVNTFDIIGKYGNIEIGTLETALTVDGYETDVRVNNLGTGADSIYFDGKYNKLFLNTGSVPFELKADMTYGDVDYPESKVERRIYIKESSKLRMELYPKSGEATLRLDLKGYEMKAEIS